MSRAYKSNVQARHIGAFAKFSNQLECWIILKPVGTGSFAHIGQGATAALAWKDAA